LLKFVTAAVAAAMVTAAPALASPPPIEAYGRLPAIDDVSLSPSGKYMLSVGAVDGRRYMLVRAVTGEVLFSQPADKIKVRQVQWVGDGHALLTASTTGNPFGDSQFIGEFAGILNIDVAAKTATPLFARNPKFPVTGYWVDASYVIAGKPIVFAEARPDLWQRFPDLWRIDLTTNEISRVAVGDPDLGGWAVDATGAIVGRSSFVRQSHIWVLYHGDTRLMLKESLDRKISLMGLGRTPGALLVLDRTSGNEDWLEVDQNGRTQTLWPGKNVTSVIVNPTTGLAIGANLDNDRNVYFDPVLQARFDAATKPFKGHTRVDSVDQSVNKVIVHTFGPGDAGTYYLVDLAAHRADIIDNDYPDVPADQVGEVRRFAFKASDGLEMDGILTLPPGRPATHLPVVVLPHGGPVGVYDDVGFDWMAQALASRGYAVIQPNYRGSGGHGEAFRQAGMGQWGRKMLSDIADALKSQVDAGVVDPKRACIMGFSYGGYAALAGVTIQQGLYRCAVGGEGPSDLTRFMHWEEGRYGYTGTAAFRDYIGLEKPNAPNLNAISPAKLAARADAPILLIHGTDDSVVPIEQSRAMEQALHAAGKPVEFVVTKGEDHWLSKDASRTETLKAAVDFIEKYNPAD
jgi:dipeptidyl aminopeptidase/acylaminoacyl peptidase